MQFKLKPEFDGTFDKNFVWVIQTILHWQQCLKSSIVGYQTAISYQIWRLAHLGGYWVHKLRYCACGFIFHLTKVICYNFSGQYVHWIWHWGCWKEMKKGIGNTFLVWLRWLNTIVDFMVYHLPIWPKQLFWTRCNMMLVFPVAELPCIIIPPAVGRSDVKCSKMSRKIHFLPIKVVWDKFPISDIFLLLTVLKIAGFGTSKNNAFNGQSPFSTGAIVKRRNEN